MANTNKSIYHIWLVSGIANTNSSMCHNQMVSRITNIIS